MKRPGVWESEQGGAATSENPRDNLASLYRSPIHLMFQGSFETAKGAASVQDKGLLVNLQSTKEFSSHMVYDDTSEGRKVCTYYKLDSVSTVLVIDPITGEKMRSWSGMVQPENLLEDLVAFMDGGPRDHHKTLSHKRPRGSSWTPDKDKEFHPKLVGLTGNPEENFGNKGKWENWLHNYADVLCVNSWQVKRYIDVYTASSVIGFF